MGHNNKNPPHRIPMTWSIVYIQYIKLRCQHRSTMLSYLISGYLAMLSKRWTDVDISTCPTKSCHCITVRREPMITENVRLTPQWRLYQSTQTNDYASWYPCDGSPAHLGWAPRTWPPLREPHEVGVPGNGESMAALSSCELSPRHDSPSCTSIAQ